MRSAAYGLFVSLALAAPATAAPETEWNLTVLMANLRAVKSASAHFVEHKHVQILTQPIEASGTLVYVAPNRLEKTTLAPSPESIVLQDDELNGTQSNGDRYSISLSDHTEIAALVEGVRSTLAGDLPTLRRYYTITCTGTDAGWQLMLVPRDDDARAKVDLIRLTGTGAALQEIDIHEADGDHSEMFVVP